MGLGARGFHFLSHFNLEAPLFHHNPKKIKYEDQLSELWAADSGPLTIICIGNRAS